MTERIRTLESEILAFSAVLAEERRKTPREEVPDFVFETQEGPRRLSELFGDRDQLLVIHNMGIGCRYCTLWADGFNGSAHHFLNRSAFVLCSPDDLATQAKVKADRNWNFPMVQDASRQFTTAMGYWTEKDGWWPGVSGFVKEGTTIYRTGTDHLWPRRRLLPHLAHDGPHQRPAGLGTKASVLTHPRSRTIQSRLCQVWIRFVGTEPTSRRPSIPALSPPEGRKGIAKVK